MANRVRTASRDNRTTKPKSTAQYSRPLNPVVAREKAVLTSLSNVEIVKSRIVERPSDNRIQSDPPTNDAVTLKPSNVAHLPGMALPDALLNRRNSSNI